MWHAACVNPDVGGGLEGGRFELSRKAIHAVLAIVGGAIAAAPAHAAGSVALPEPGGLTLLSLGIAGLLIGRRAARKPPHD